MYILLETLIVLAILTVIIILYFKWRFKYWERRGVLCPEPVIPFGNVSVMIKQKITFGLHLKNLYDEFKNKGLKYFGFYFHIAPSLVLIDLDLIKLILTKDFEHFTDHINYINEKVDPMTGNLFHLKGQKWRNLRINLTPTFTSGKIKMMLQILIDCTKGFFDLIDNTIKSNEPLDIKDVFSRYTTDVIASCAFGIECNSLKNPNSEFRNYGKKIFEGNRIQAIVRSLSITFPFILDTFKLRFYGKEESDFFANIVHETVRYREKNHIIRNDFMHLLIQLKNNINIKKDIFTMEQLTAQAFVFFLAGFETSSTTLTFCFYELAINTNIQSRLRKEINTVLKKHQGHITYEALMEMSYMDNCIQETLRKYPPLPVLLRECTKTYKIPNSNVIINKGDKIFIPIHGIHNDEEYYPTPERFDPTRFSQENKSNRHSCTWLPFGDGPRVCIGLRFGLMQIKVVLVMLLKHYEFSLNSKTKIPLVISPKSIILTVKDGVWLNAKAVEH